MRSLSTTNTAEKQICEINITINDKYYMIRYIGSVYTEAIRFETINFLYMCVYRFESVHIATHSPYKVICFCFCFF